jgi:hypothetical protein
MQGLAAGIHLLIHFLYEEKLWNSADSLIKCKKRGLDDNSDSGVKKIIVEEINTQLVDLRLGSRAQTGG